MGSKTPHGGGSNRRIAGQPNRTKTKFKHRPKTPMNVTPHEPETTATLMATMAERRRQHFTTEESPHWGWRTIGGHYDEKRGVVVGASESPHYWLAGATVAELAHAGMLTEFTP